MTKIYKNQVLIRGGNPFAWGSGTKDCFANSLVLGWNGQREKLQKKVQSGKKPYAPVILLLYLMILVSILSSTNPISIKSSCLNPAPEDDN